MRIKASASIQGLKAELLLGLIVVCSVFDKYKVELIVTEVTGGQHKHESLHYVGLAADIRSKHIDSDALKDVLLAECREALGRDFDMILESLGKEQEHYHLEFDPK